MKITKIIILLLLFAAIAVSSAGCGEPAEAEVVAKVKTDNLMKNISSKSVSGKSADASFNASMADFSIKLFKEAITDKENSLVSPTSVMLALAMTANGADSETLAQMEQLLGGNIALSDLNEYLYSYVESLPSGEKSKLGIANSIWFRDDENRLRVEPDFLQKNADYYDASVFKSDFGEQTVKDINDWVKSNTDGLIESIIEEIKDDSMLYLINAVVFDAEWQKVYDEHSVRKGDFTDINGAVQNVDFMHSSEYQYLDDGRATGFIKPYYKNNYSFAALLPNEGVSIEEYIESLTGEGFIDAVANAQDTLVYASMPKFEYEYEIQMNEALKTLGIPDAFDMEKADFRKMATSSDGNIFIGEVRHKTYISVDERGTKAGAVTSVTMFAGGAPMDPKTVQLDRPFVYAVIDNATNLPVFIGTMMTIE